MCFSRKQAKKIVVILSSSFSKTGRVQKTWTKSSIGVACRDLVSTSHRVPTGNVSKTTKSTFFIMFLLSMLLNTV